MSNSSHFNEMLESLHLYDNQFILKEKIEKTRVAGLVGNSSLFFLSLMFVYKTIENWISMRQLNGLAVVGCFDQLRIHQALTIPLIFLTLLLFFLGYLTFLKDHSRSHLIAKFHLGLLAFILFYSLALFVFEFTGLAFAGCLQKYSTVYKAGFLERNGRVFMIVSGSLIILMNFGFQLFYSKMWRNLQEVEQARRRNSEAQRNPTSKQETTQNQKKNE